MTNSYPSYTPIEYGGTHTPRVLVTIGDLKKHPLSRVFSEIFPEKISLFRENGNTHADPLRIQVGGGGGQVLIR